MANDPMRQNATDWVPTPEQAALLEAATESGLKRNILAVCKKAGIHRATFYRWMDEDPGFRRAWSDLWEKIVDIHFNAAMAAMAKKAEAGNVPATRLLAEMKGVLKNRIELTGKDGGPVQTFDMSKLSDAQLDALIALDPSLAGGGAGGTDSGSK